MNGTPSDRPDPPDVPTPSPSPGESDPRASAARAASDRAASLRAVFAASPRAARASEFTSRDLRAHADPADPPSAAEASPSGMPARRRRRLRLAPVLAGLLALGAVAGVLAVNHERNAAAGRTATTAGDEGPAGRPAATGVAGLSVPSATPSTEPASAAPASSAAPSLTVSPSVSRMASARANPDRVNLALHRTATASSTESGSWPASAAVDGSMESRWSSGFADPQWIKVDLGAVWAVSDVRLAWEHAYAVTYRVDISLDARRWSTVYRTTVGADGTRDIHLAPVPARYVRMYGTKRVSQYGYSLLEFEVR